MIDVGLENGVWITGTPPKAFWTHKRVLEPWMRRMAMSPPGTDLAEKPVDEAFARAPQWEKHLRFAADLLVRILERAPGIGSVHSLRVQNPSYGFFFADDDTRELSGDLRTTCARAFIGNMVEEGTLIVNGEQRFRFLCDCRGKVNLYIELHDLGSWLLPWLNDDVQDAARANDVEARFVNA